MDENVHLVFVGRLREVSSRFHLLFFWNLSVLRVSMILVLVLSVILLLPIILPLRPLILILRPLIL